MAFWILMLLFKTMTCIVEHGFMSITKYPSVSRGDRPLKMLIVGNDWELWLGFPWTLMCMTVVQKRWLFKKVTRMKSLFLCLSENKWGFKVTTESEAYKAAYSWKLFVNSGLASVCLFLNSVIVRSQMPPNLFPKCTDSTQRCRFYWSF